MTNKQSLSLLNDTLLGRLFCIYIKLNQPRKNIYYLIVNWTDPLMSTIPSLRRLGFCDTKITLSIDTFFLLEDSEKELKVYSQQPVPLSITSHHARKIEETIKKLKKLLKKYEVDETPIEAKDVGKISMDEEILNTLNYVITFDQNQYKKLSAYLKQYYKLYVEKELDGQQNYFLPNIYANEILSTVNNPQYIEKSGYKNLSIQKSTNPFFYHSIMLLTLQKEIKIRKMIITQQTVHFTIDNLTHESNLTPQALLDKQQYRFENNTLFINLKDGTQTSLDFEDQRDTKNMLAVFSILYKHWQIYQNQPLEVLEIDRRLVNKKKLAADLVNTTSFLSNTISNIRKKIRGKHLEDLIIIKREGTAYSLIIN